MATTNRLKRTDLAKWVTTNTFFSNGKNFSFKDHEFQERILNDPSQELVIIKSAQMGVSEMSLRMAVGMVMMMPDSFSAGYVFPTAGFATQYSKTRFNPIVQNSPLLRSSINSDDLDSADVKTFGLGRQMYFKGAATGNSAISTTLDAVFFDEYSFMDQEVAGDYTSRLIHSKHKIKVKLSTPTFPGDPIDSAYQASRRWMNFCKCDKCNEQFYPNFYEHVKVPGYNKHLDEITADNLHSIEYDKAVVLCPRCGRAPSLQPEHREWVCENPTQRYIATGYRISPFDAPNVITIPYLLEASTSYASKAKFRQFSLGMPAADAESGLTAEELDDMCVEGSGSPYNNHVMGIDLGMVCHFTVGGIGPDGKLGIVHMERVPLPKFRERYFSLTEKFRVTVKVSDIQPYTDLIMGLCEIDQNLFGASYTSKAGLELFALKVREEDAAEAQGALREVALNRNAVFDRLLVEVRAGRLWVRKTEEWEVYKAHMQDMKRASLTLRNGEYTSQWQKSARGIDHYHHSTAYCFIASLLRGVSTGHTASGLPGVSKFKNTGGLITSPEQIRAQMLALESSNRWGPGQYPR
jgi:hypothetical protein